MEYFSLLKTNELSSHKKIWRIFKCILTTKQKPIGEGYIWYDSNYMPFQKRQNCGNDKKMSASGRMVRSKQRTEDF